MQIMRIGCIGHSASGCFHYANSQYTMTIADRGGFSDFHHKSIDSDKYASVRSITFKETDLSKVTKILNLAQYCNSTEAERMIFKELPGAVASEFKHDLRIFQSSQKEGTCFISSPKAMVYKLLLDELESELGSIIFKEFTLFMREQILKIYRALVGDADPLVKECEQILAPKRERLQQKKHGTLYAELKSGHEEVKDSSSPTNLATKKP